MRHDSASSDHRERLAELQDQLYDLVVTRVTQPHVGAVERLRRDAQHAAALAEDLADVALRIINGDAPPS
jgi:hypothetical protein